MPIPLKMSNVRVMVRVDCTLQGIARQTTAYVGTGPTHFSSSLLMTCQFNHHHRGSLVTSPVAAVRSLLMWIRACEWN